MTAPGMALRRWAATWLPPATMARVVDPALADLQHEVRHARVAGRHVRAIWLHGVGTLGVLCTLLILAAPWVSSIPQELSTNDRRNVVGTLAWASVAGCAGLGLLAAWPYWYISQSSQADGLRLLLLLIPQAVPIAGAMFVIVAALAARSEIRAPRVLACLGAMALVVTMVSLVVSGWVLPATNQAARELALNHGVWRGLNELRIDELYALAAHGVRPPDLLAHAADGAVLGLHARLAFAVSPALFAMLAWRLVSRTIRSSTAAATSLLALLGYVRGMMLVGSSDVPPVSPLVQAWLSTAAVVVLAVLVRGRWPVEAARE